MGMKSRRKGARVEYETVHKLQNAGFAAEKISRMYKPGSDISMPLLGVDRGIEVKSRATGFSRLYDWLEDRFALVLKADRKDALVGIRLRDAVEIAKTAERSRT